MGKIKEVLTKVKDAIVGVFKGNKGNNGKKKKKDQEYTIYYSEGATIMANVELKWNANASAEGIKEYAVFKNGAEVARVPAPPYVDLSVPPGVYTYEVAAINDWLEPGAKSDPVKTPPPPTKPTGVVLSIKVTVNQP